MSRNNAIDLSSSIPRAQYQPPFLLQILANRSEMLSVCGWKSRPHWISSLLCSRKYSAIPVSIIIWYLLVLQMLCSLWRSTYPLPGVLPIHYQWPISDVSLIREVSFRIQCLACECSTRIRTKHRLPAMMRGIPGVGLGGFLDAGPIGIPCVHVSQSSSFQTF